MLCLVRRSIQFHKKLHRDVRWDSTDPKTCARPERAKDTIRDIDDHGEEAIAAPLVSASGLFVKSHQEGSVLVASNNNTTTVGWFLLFRSPANNKSGRTDEVQP